MNVISSLKSKMKKSCFVAATTSSAVAVMASVSHAAEGDLLTGITLDTATVLAGAAIVLAGYGALWAINKVIGVFKK